MIDSVVLRRKIIDAAVFGELTDHISTEGNADVWLKEHGCGLSNVSNINEDVTLPSNWCWTTLSSITDENTLNDGNWVLSADMVSDGPVKLIQLGSIGEGVYRNKGFKYLTEEHFHELKGRQIFPGHLLINRLVADRMVSCIIPDLDGILMTAVDVCWVAPQDELYSLKYIMYAISTSLFQQRVNELGHGVTRFRISKNNLIDIPFPFPPLKEQLRIVEIVEDLFSITYNIDDLQTRYAADRDVLKGKLIDAAICGKLTKQLPEDGTAEDLYKKIQEEKKQILIERKGRADKKIKEIDADVPFAIPTQWKWIRFGDVGLFKKGPFGSALTKSMFVPKSDNTVKVYEQQHAIKKNCNLGTYYIKREYFDSDMSGFEVLTGDIIVSCAGTIGETYIMPDEIEQGIINQALMRVTLAAGIDKRFFQYYFDANLKKSAQDESNGSAIKNIPPFDVMKNWYFPLPPFAEQQRIVETLDNLLTNLTE